MSEFQDRHTVSRLIGAPPGYLGHDEAGQLTDAVRRTPYTRGAAGRDREGTPRRARTSCCKSSMTAGSPMPGKDGRTSPTRDHHDQQPRRRGSCWPAASAGRSVEEDARTPLTGPRVRQHFRPEFLNRLDEIVAVPRPSFRPGFARITELLLEQTRQRLHARRITLAFDEGAIDWLVDRGYQPEFGARPLRRVHRP